MREEIEELTTSEVDEISAGLQFWDWLKKMKGVDDPEGD
jgi:hypothetical protein